MTTNPDPTQARTHIDAAKLQEALDRLRQEHIRYETANNRGLYVTGYLDGIEIAYNWINKALGGTP